MGGTPSSAKGKEAALKIQGTAVVKDGFTRQPSVRQQDQTKAPNGKKPNSPLAGRPAPPSTSPPPKPRPGGAKTAPLGSPQHPTPEKKGGGQDPGRGKADVQLPSSAEKTAAPDAEAAARRKRLQEQEDASLEQMTAQQFKAYEAQRKREEEEEKKRLAEEASLEQMAAQQYKAYEAQRKKEAEDAKKREQEDASLEQMTAQKFKAYEAERKKEEDAKKRHQEEKSVSQSKAGAGGRKKEEQKKTLEEQEELSIEQMNIQQYKAYEAKMQRKKEQEEAEAALQEADEMLDMYAPPKARREFNSVRRNSLLVTDDIPLSGFSPDSGLSEDRDEISEIVKGRIYLTNYRGVERVEDLQDLDVRHIVCVNEQANEHPDTFNYFNIDSLEDQEDHDATVHFQSVKDFTDQALESGGAVVFHCAAGISRSSTMTIAYLMSSEKVPLLRAFAMCYHARRVTWPNRSFMRQLIAYERDLQKKGVLSGCTPSITLEQWDEWSAS